MKQDIKLDKWGWIAFIALLVGGIDLGIYGLIHIDIIGTILGGLLSRLVYIVIGVAAGYILYLWVYKKSL
ncbi:MAG: hypothetical protein A3E83_04630 [Gammaproteobacteria bacterium RIFCSPHIGHO2_12_FULL_41_20]|nr:MAG: hypothetical protein A3E83_04630 [Gammaproteobacteria bacterium RIFCSPHIGHO2_12_FULL_41_20]